MNNIIFNKLMLLAKSFGEVLYSSDDFFIENMKENNLAGDDVEKYRYWEWTQGVGLFGLWKIYKYTGKKAYLDELCKYYDERIEQGLPSKNINTTAPMLTLAHIYEETCNEKYLKVCNEWAEWVMSGLTRTLEGGFQHITSDSINAGELWDDTLFMCVLFLAKMGQITENEKYTEEALYQFLLHAKYLQDKKSGLWFHGWTFNGRHNFTEALWGRGNCWITLAIPEFLKITDLLNNQRKYLIEVLEKQVASLAQYQNENGMWHTLIDDSTSYIESSATCGFAAGILQAVGQGLIEKSYADTALLALDTILSLIDEKGILHQVSYGTPMGRETKDFYKEIPLKSMPYGQALAMLYLVEVLTFKGK